MTSRSESSPNAAEYRETLSASTSASGYCANRCARRPGTGSTTGRRWRSSGSSGASGSSASPSRTSVGSCAFGRREGPTLESESSDSCGRGPMLSTARSGGSSLFVRAWTRASGSANALPLAAFRFSSALPWPPALTSDLRRRFRRLLRAGSLEFPLRGPSAAERASNRPGPGVQKFRSTGAKKARSQPLHRWRLAVCPLGVEDNPRETRSERFHPIDGETLIPRDSDFARVSHPQRAAAQGRAPMPREPMEHPEATR